MDIIYTEPTKEQQKFAADNHGVWKKSVYLDHDLCDKLIEQKVANQELSEKVMTVWKSMDVYNETHGSPALIDYWSTHSKRSIISEWHIVKQVVESANKSMWELVIDNPIDAKNKIDVTHRQENELRDVFASNGQWVGCDDSGGWFGGD